MKHLPVYALLVFVSYTLYKGQNKTNLPPDTIKFVPEEVITTHGPSTSVRIIRQDMKGNMWLASNEGIIRYDGKSFTNITGALSAGRYFSLIEDRKGNFWFGTYNSGVYYYDGKSFQHFTTKQGLASNLVSTIYEDKTGNIWFGTDGGVSRYDGKSFQNFTTEGNIVNAISEEKTGKLWFGTRGFTYIYDGKTFTVFTYKDNFFKDVWSIIEDKKGNIWLGGGKGLWRYDGSTFNNFTENSVNYVYEDKKGNLWTSGRNDDGKFAFSRYDRQSFSDKKPTVSEIAQSLNLFGILESNDGRIWFGAYDGVYRYDGNTITDFIGKEDQK